MDTILKAEHLTKIFAGKHAVNDISMTIHRGDIYGFIGENGAGKTTLMRMVCGLADPTSGSIELFGGKSLNAARERMGCTIENPAIYPAMTALENLEVQRRLLGVQDAETSAKLLTTVGLQDVGQKKARDFSLGMKQRLMLALALMNDPEFLVLDEPTNGLDPMGIKEIRDLILKLNRERGLTILISSHILGELEKIATCYGVIKNGSLVEQFGASDLEGRCNHQIRMTVDDPARVAVLLENIFPGVQYECMPDGGTIRVDGHVQEIGRLNRALCEAGITVNSIAPTGEDLETYFMELMGGNESA